RTSLIILTRNEIEGLRAVLSRIPTDTVDEVFAVDYRSKDGTVEYFRTHGIAVIKQRKPGRAEAFRIGVTHASGEYLIFFSPDGNEDPRDIPALVDKLLLGYDLVIASRFLTGSRNEEDDQLFKFRAWANRGLTCLANVFFRGHVSDTINGYRAITRQAYSSMHLDAKGFAVEYQMTIRAMKRGLHIAEIPTLEGNRIGGKSTSYAIPTGIQFVGYLLREVWIGNNF
ncbi:MAG TPA: glycosyltransferase family 2 protein, partial [Patescibacteria group bacterium]|nr:glycosyltransferase family 2 protein [Patescibacteria group bacterium]